MSLDAIKAALEAQTSAIAKVADDVHAMQAAPVASVPAGPSDVDLAAIADQVNANTKAIEAIIPAAAPSMAPPAAA